MDKEIAKKSGLVFCGKNEEGEDMFIGTTSQWVDADTMLTRRDNEVDKKEEDTLKETQNAYYDEGMADMKYDEMKDDHATGDCKEGCPVCNHSESHEEFSNESPVEGI